MLEDTVDKIFWDYDEESIKQLPLQKQEELARYCIGKILSKKCRYEAHGKLVAIGKPALKYLFPALEKDKYNWTLDSIIDIAKKGVKEEDEAARLAVGTLHNPLSWFRGVKVVRVTGKRSSEYLTYALGDSSVCEYAERELRILCNNPRYRDAAVAQLQRASDPANKYKPIVQQRAANMLNSLPVNRNL